MFRLNGEPERLMLPRAGGRSSEVRQGAPFDLWRIVRMLRRNRWLLIMAAVTSMTIGAVTGRYLLVKTYAAKSVLLWEPPASARADANREISTLVDSVKLPTNLDEVRTRTAYAGTLEQLAKQNLASGLNEDARTFSRFLAENVRHLLEENHWYFSLYMRLKYGIETALGRNIWASYKLPRKRSERSICSSNCAISPDSSSKLPRKKKLATLWPSSR